MRLLRHVSLPPSGRSVGEDVGELVAIVSGELDVVGIGHALGVERRHTHCRAMEQDKKEVDGEAAYRQQMINTGGAKSCKSINTGSLTFCDNRCSQEASSAIQRLRVWSSAAAAAAAAHLCSCVVYYARIACMFHQQHTCSG